MNPGSPHMRGHWAFDAPACRRAHIRAALRHTPAITAAALALIAAIALFLVVAP